MIPSESWKRFNPNYHAAHNAQSIAKLIELIFISSDVREREKKRIEIP